ncbi:unnamed protein product [Auanema sp. JU1783]|nr:unnamed protein product [Auanema sp. JU1783]
MADPNFGNKTGEWPPKLGYPQTSNPYTYANQISNSQPPPSLSNNSIQPSQTFVPPAFPSSQANGIPSFPAQGPTRLAQPGVTASQPPSAFKPYNQQNSAPAPPNGSVVRPRPPPPGPAQPNAPLQHPASAPNVPQAAQSTFSAPPMPGMNTMPPNPVSQFAAPPPAMNSSYSAPRNAYAPPVAFPPNTAEVAMSQNATISAPQPAQAAMYNPNPPVMNAQPSYVNPGFNPSNTTQNAPTYGAPYQQPNSYPQGNNVGYGTQQLQQGFNQMNVSNQGGWNGQAPNVDLMTDRNVIHQFNEEVAYELPPNMANSQARIDTGVFRSTLNAVPQTEEILKKSRLPFGLTLHPFRDMKNLNIIQTSVIVRCKYCRTYINPFVQMPDNRHWKCNCCNRLNELRDDFCWDHVTKTFGDPVHRPEIQHATVEFIAPSEYMLRPPQPAVYVFVIDVSAPAIESGYLYTLSEQLLINLDVLPGDDRTQLAFIAVDSSIHFFQFSSTGNLPPKQLIVDDIDEMFLPTNSGLLVSLKKNKERVRAFIQQIPTIFEKPTSSVNCLGAALNIAHELIADIGGRISLFQATLPSNGPGALTSREDPNQRAAPEVQNLGPANDFYKRVSLECTGHQIALDLFMFNSQYSDIATLSEVAKFSTGCVYYFPNYHCLNDTVQVKRFEKILSRYLTRKIGFEAVLRIRCSRGLGLSAFYGNFFLRSTDLLALANVNPDSAIAVQVNMEEKLGPTVSFQAALLYTSSKGDRRIRVHTICLPTTTDLKKVYSSFDVKAAISLLAKIGVERSMTGSPLSDSREAIVNAVVDTLGAYQKTCAGRGNLFAPREGHLRMYPLFALSMLKHNAFIAGRSIRLDDRVGAMLNLRFSPLEQILSEFYPKLYRINEITQFGNNEWPPYLPLSFEHINRDGVYFMEAGSSSYLYVSSSSDQNVVSDLFGCQYSQIGETFTELSNPMSEKFFAFLKHVSSQKFYLGPVIIIKEDSPKRELFVRKLIDDRSESSHSYIEFLQHIKREISNN